MGSVTNIATKRAAVTDDRLSRFFGADSDSSDFAARRQAETYLEARGFSYGAMQGACPIGIEYGECTIGKWRGLSPEEQNDLHGQIVSDNFRKGRVTIRLRPDAPSAVIEAFNAGIDEPSNVVSLDSARGSQPDEGRPDAALMGFDAADQHEAIDPPGVFVDDGNPRAVRVTAGADLAAQRFVERGSKP